MEDFKWTDKLVKEFARQYAESGHSTATHEGCERTQQFFEEFKKSKQSDRKEIYDLDQRVYKVNENYILSSIPLSIELRLNNKNCKYFSTKEAAEDWILHNLV